MDDFYKKIGSYLFPITKKMTSDFSGELEITWYNGKKYLNTKNANYSYGSLQEILLFGLKKVHFKNIDSILILGLGGGSVVQTLREDLNYSKKITALDIDAKIIDIAKSEFGIEENEHLKIICQDAFDFVQKKNNFNGIIIDLFIDSKVPEKFYGNPFWNAIVNSIPKEGFILFNASLENAVSLQIETIQAFLKENNFEISIFEKVENTNTLVLAQKK